jgi:hypothetical protein
MPLRALGRTDGSLTIALDESYRQRAITVGGFLADSVELPVLAASWRELKVEVGLDPSNDSSMRFRSSIRRGPGSMQLAGGNGIEFPGCWSGSLISRSRSSPTHLSTNGAARPGPFSSSTFMPSTGAFAAQQTM